MGEVIPWIMMSKGNAQVAVLSLRKAKLSALHAVKVLKMRMSRYKFNNHGVSQMKNFFDEDNGWDDDGDGDDDS